MEEEIEIEDLINDYLVLGDEADVPVEVWIDPR